MEGFDQDDLQNAILCVWKEARGDGYEAMNAVAHSSSTGWARRDSLTLCTT